MEVNVIFAEQKQALYDTVLVVHLHFTANKNKMSHRVAGLKNSQKSVTYYLNTPDGHTKLERTIQIINFSLLI